MRRRRQAAPRSGGSAPRWKGLSTDRRGRWGLVEAISGREPPGRFLFSATAALFEQDGSTRIRQVGKHAWIVSRVVPAA